MKKFCAPVILAAVLAVVGLTGPAANAATSDDITSVSSIRGSISQPTIGNWPYR